MALKLNWGTRFPELSTFALLLFQITKVSDSQVSYSLPWFPPTISNSFLESRCPATRQVQGLGALRFHEGPRIWVFGGGIEGRGQRLNGELGDLQETVVLQQEGRDLGAREGSVLQISGVIC